MTTQEVAQQLVDLCRQGKFHEAIDTLYSKDIVSIEAGAPPGGSREVQGIDAVMAKGKWWQDNHEVHGLKVEGPLVAEPFFCVRFEMDVTFKPQDKRFVMQELAMYQVADGKVAREEFFYKLG